MSNTVVDAYLQTPTPSLADALATWHTLMRGYYEEWPPNPSDEEVEELGDYFDSGRIAIQDRASAIPVRDVRDLLEKAKLAHLFFDEMANLNEMDNEKAPLTAAETRSFRGMLAAICADLETLVARSPPTEH